MMKKTFVVAVMLLVAFSASSWAGEVLPTGTMRGTAFYATFAKWPGIETLLERKGVPQVIAGFPFRRAWSELAEFGIFHDPDFAGKKWPQLSSEDRRHWAHRVCAVYQIVDHTRRLWNDTQGRLAAIELTPGPQGPAGEVGPQGFTGQQGPPGTHGREGLQGQQGPEGPPGRQGLTGPQGPYGQRGQRGSLWFSGRGNPDFRQVGYIGVQQFDMYLDASCGNVWQYDGKCWISVGCLMGPRGPEGPQGLMGPKGDTGDRGPEGPQGQQGYTGPAGPQGLKGDQGDTGDRGLEGPQGERGELGYTGPMGPVGPTVLGWQTLPSKGEASPAGQKIYDTRGIAIPGVTNSDVRPIGGAWGSRARGRVNSQEDPTCGSPPPGGVPEPTPGDAFGSPGNPSGQVPCPPDSDPYQPPPQADHGIGGMPWDPNP